MPIFTIDNHEINASLILFDIDGTLVDDVNRYKHLARARYDAFIDLLSEREAKIWAKLEGITMDPLKIDMDGPLSKAPRREDLIIASTAIYLNGTNWNDAKEAANKVYNLADQKMKEIYSPKLFPKVDDTLKSLKLNGFKLGIATNGDSRISSELFEGIGVLSLFDVIVGADKVDEAKPSPEMIFMACDNLKTRPLETVYVGDQPTDIQAGKAAKVGYVIAVGNRLLMHEADFYVKSVADFKVMSVGGS
jgi:phosphoglycolate phosphatase